MNTSFGSQPSGEPVKPLEELTHLLDRLEARIDGARRSCYNGLVEAANPPPPATAPSTSTAPSRLGRFLGRSRQRSSGDSSTPPRAAAAPSPGPSPMRPAADGADEKGKPVADFLPFPEEVQDAFVEDLRRAAELCVIGEHFVTNLQKQEERQRQRDVRRWNAARDGLLDPSESEQSVEEGDGLAESDEKIQLFDLFFERNGLALIVDMLSGESFDFVKNPIQNDEEEEQGEGTEQPEKKEPELEDKTLLPPLSIATQALQSISILIQNVSRAMSLYVILSNNYINKLIQLPLDLYTTAEKRRMMATKESKALPAAFASPQITELTTHFVTFLKSLAMRMNGETLQFFLKYAVDDRSEFDGDDNDGAEEPPADLLNNVPKVEFPLYERALEFCAAHQDSFVRTTAMNICLNTLRLTTIVDKDDELDGSAGSGARAAKSPDGVLHNARALPFRERLVVAQYACIPSRVEHLISPIFSKLAERWSALDEAIRNIDTNKHMGAAETTDDVSARNERVALAKEKVRRERLIRAFRNKVADLQDELLLMDDVFKVRLSVLLLFAGLQQFCEWIAY